MYRPGDKAENVQTRLEDVLESLKDNPITAIDPMTKSPVVISYSDFRLLLFTILYGPTAGFSALALMMNMIYEGQGEQLGQFLAPAYVQDLKPVCSNPLPAWTYPNEAQNAIMCSDKRYKVSYPMVHSKLRSNIRS